MHVIDKDTETFGVLAFTRMSRNEKRKIIVKFENRNMTVLEYIDKVAKLLPAAVEEETKKPVNHVINIRSIFLKRGIVGIGEYVELVVNSNAVEKKDGSN